MTRSSNEKSDLEYMECINIAKDSIKTESQSQNTENRNKTDDSSGIHVSTNQDESNGSNSNNSDTELTNLIKILKKGYAKQEPGIKVIKYPELLISSLEELNNLVGLHRLKESVAMQTVKMIENLKNGEKSMQMLNTVLTGPPGVGKTTAGIILAKIWHALGFLDVDKSYVKKTVVNSDLSNYAGIIFLLLIWAMTYIISAISFMYNNLGLFWLAFVVGIFVLIIFILYYNRETIIKYTVVKEETKQDREIISVVSRADFVADFLGQTAGKTKKLLEANIGKVLFIDEAYSLLNDPRDAYGFEALNTLNMFLSENPDKIIVIFAGYKDYMDNTIFQFQPGLKRRVMYFLECDKYSGTELHEIFMLKVNKEGWIISEEDQRKIEKLICRNELTFVNQGGDMDRLLYLSSLEKNRSKLNKVDDSFLSTGFNNKSSRSSKSSKSFTENRKVLKFEHVEKGLILLKENQS